MSTPPTESRVVAGLDAATAVLPYVERWLAYRAWQLRVPGVQYAVWFDDRVQLSGAVGVADATTGAPLTAAHLFRVASHSKTFTATAVLQLLEEGRLRLDDELCAHLPEVAEAPSGIGRVRLRALLEHGGGVLRDGLDGDHWQHARPFPDAAELLAMVHADGVKAEADTRFDYSNLGYSLLGQVVERVSGLSYADYLDTRIIAPLGLADTHADLDPARLAAYAAGHTGLHTSLQRRRLAHVPTGAMAAATGVVSTASDLVRFVAALRTGTGQLLTDASKRLQRRRAWTSSPGRGAGYGLGLILEEVAGREVIGHSGGYPGHITRTLLDPADGIAISVLTNAVDGPAAELSAGVLALIDAALIQPPRLPLVSGSSAARPGSLGDTSRFEGRFATVWGVVDVVRLGERLVMTSPGGPDPVASLNTLEVVDDDTLRIADGDGFGSVGELVHYERDETGATTRIRSGGQSFWPWEVGEELRSPWPETD